MADAPTWRRWLPGAIALVLFVVAVATLHRELAALDAAALRAALAALPSHALALAAALTAANYAALAGYDLLAVRYAGRVLPWWKVAFASFIAYSVSNSVGWGVVSGTAVRHRFYTRWRLDALDLSRIVAFYMTSFWLGLLLLGGLALLLEHQPVLAAAGLNWAGRLLGAALVASVTAYAVLAAFGRQPLAVFGLKLKPPGPRLVGAQLLLSCADWLLAASVLWALLPAGGPPFGVVLGAFLAAQLLGLVSHVPGGVGVFEGAMALLLHGSVPGAALISALLLYRAIYYLAPLALALAMLAFDALRQHRESVLARGAAIEQALSARAPQLLAAGTFIAGVVLLVSGATPAIPERLHSLGAVVHPNVIAVSHFMGSVLGVVLLLLAQGIARRLRVALAMVLAVLTAAALASLLKGVDYEEAGLLLLIAALLWRARDRFERESDFLAAPSLPRWTLTAVATVLGSYWLGLFAFRHVEYSQELWWRFELEHDASRFLRASVGAALALVAFGLLRLLRPARPVVLTPDATALAAAERVIAAHGGCDAQLALLGDKALLFAPEGDAFLMYGVQGRSWVALGDPVGPPARVRWLLREFAARAAEHDGDAVFYEVGSMHLGEYVDLGLSVLKLGEEARVPLAGFDLGAARWSKLRQALNRVEREGARFHVLERAAVRARLAELRAVSAAWLEGKRASEKGFSLGRFDDDYVLRFRCAVLERGTSIVAFATLFEAPATGELSVDLMRFAPDAPKGAMDALFSGLLRLGHEQGYAEFSLGMAPLAGLEAVPHATAWHRLGRLVFRNGEAFYNFRGLRAYKDKFAPEWRARFLAAPGGLALPRVLADIASLISGGWARILR